MNLRKLIEAFRAYRRGAPLGDVVMLKLDAVASPPGEVERKLENVAGFAPKHDVVALRELPPGTVGHAYARFLDGNGITPLEVSEAMRQRFASRPYALRYTTTHDLHHVLAGFDAGLAGEIGVLAFNVGQGVAPVGKARLLFASAFYSLVSPTQAGRIWHNLGVGLRLGRAAELVIAAPIESWFAEPIDVVRARLRIAEPDRAGVVPSGTSFVVRKVTPSAPAEARAE